MLNYEIAFLLDYTQKRLPILIIIILIGILAFQYMVNFKNPTTIIDSETCELYIKDNQINSKKYLNEYDTKCLELKNFNSP